MVLNNYTPFEKEFTMNTFLDIFEIFFCSEEVGASGTPHLQAYGETIHPTTIRALQDKISRAMVQNGPNNRMRSRWAIKIAVADRQKNYAYCTKSSPLLCCKPNEADLLKVIVPRVLSDQRKRKLELIDSIKSGMSCAAIAREYPDIYMQSSNGIDKLTYHYQPRRTWLTIGYWLSGATGTGKSRWAAANFPDAYYKDPETDWWDGYQAHETVIVDDFRPSKTLSFSKILRLVDRYPLTVQVKGATVQFAAKRILFTSPYPLLETFARCDWLKDEELNQLSRRFPHQLSFAPGLITNFLTKLPQDSLPTEAEDI